MKNDPQKILRRPDPIIMFNDCLSPFEVVIRATSTIEKLLMASEIYIDISAVKTSYNSKDRQKINIILSDFNPADALTEYKSDFVLH